MGGGSGAKRRGGVKVRHLILCLESPLMSFGGETIDNYGVIRPFPAASMLTGLFANALGWRRVERGRHQSLQDRLIFAARIDQEPAGGVRMRDYQTALLHANDEGWTTRGRPEGRNKNSPSYKAERPGGERVLTNQRYRDYFADMRATVALRLDSAEDPPTLDELADALQEPARPLFIGRKPCLPSAPLFAGFAEGDTALAALLNAPLSTERPSEAAVRSLWPDGEGAEGIDSYRDYMLTDQRNWISGLHGGGRMVCERAIDKDKFRAHEDAETQRGESGP